jgi:hypothetical protein
MTKTCIRLALSAESLEITFEESKASDSTNVDIGDDTFLASAGTTPEAWTGLAAVLTDFDLKNAKIALAS